MTQSLFGYILSFNNTHTRIWDSVILIHPLHAVILIFSFFHSWVSAFWVENAPTHVCTPFPSSVLYSGDPSRVSCRSFSEKLTEENYTRKKWTGLYSENWLIVSSNIFLVLSVKSELINRLWPQTVCLAKQDNKTLKFWELVKAFFTILWHFMGHTNNKSIKKIISNLIYNENNHELQP